MKLNKIFKWCMVVLVIISAALLVWGFAVGFETEGGSAVDRLLYWAYVMVGLALVSWVIVGGIVSVKNNPKSLVKGAILLVVLAAVCFVAYLLAPGTPAVGRTALAVPDSLFTLKLTDTILNLTYFAGAAVIIAIIVGEIRLAITNRK